MYKVVLRNGNEYERENLDLVKEKYNGYKSVESSDYDIIEIYREIPSLIYKEGLSKEELNDLRVKDLGLKLGEIEKKIMNLEMERNEIVYEIWRRLPKLVLDEELQPRSEKEIKLRWK